MPGCLCAGRCRRADRFHAAPGGRRGGGSFALAVAAGRWQTPGVRLGCIPLHATSPAPCRASSIWLCLVWAWPPCAPAAWPVPVPACRLDAFHRAPGGGAAGVSFALGFRRQTTTSTKNTRGRPSFQKTAVERGIASAGRVIPREKTEAPYTNQLLRNSLLLCYLLGNAWGQSVECPASRSASVCRSGGYAAPPGGLGSSCAPLVRVIRPPVIRCSAVLP